MYENEGGGIGRTAAVPCGNGGKENRGVVPVVPIG